MAHIQTVLPVGRASPRHRKAILKLQMASDRPYCHAAFPPNGKILVSGAKDGVSSVDGWMHYIVVRDSPSLHLCRRLLFKRLQFHLVLFDHVVSHSVHCAVLVCLLDSRVFPR